VIDNLLELRAFLAQRAADLRSKEAAGTLHYCPTHQPTHSETSSTRLIITWHPTTWDERFSPAMSSTRHAF